MKHHRVLRTVAAFVLLLAPVAARADDVDPATPPPAARAAATTLAPGATINAGDKLAVSVYGDPSLSQTVVVQADGTVQYPLVGRVPVAGSTPAQAKATFTRAFTRYLKHPVVAVSIAESGQMGVLVMGNVKLSGKYSVRSGAHLTDAIAAASGVRNLNGAYPLVRIAKPDGTVETADLDALLRKGDVTQNPVLADNSIVYVTGADTIIVKVLGAVSRPGNVEVNQGDRLSTALARAGVQSSAHPDLNRVTVERTDPVTKKATSYQLDVYQSLQKGDVRYDPILQKDDVVFIPESRQTSPATIGLLGILGRLLRF